MITTLKYYGLGDVASEVGVHANTIRNWVLSGMLDCYKVRGVMVFTDKQIEQAKKIKETRNKNVIH